MIKSTNFTALVPKYVNIWCKMCMTLYHRKYEVEHERLHERLHENGGQKGLPLSALYKTSATQCICHAVDWSRSEGGFKWSPLKF